MIYKIEIIETLQKIVEIEADDEDSAYLKAKKMYREGNIVLDASNSAITSAQNVRSASSLPIRINEIVVCSTVVCVPAQSANGSKSNTLEIKNTIFFMVDAPYISFLSVAKI